MVRFSQFIASPASPTLNVLKFDASLTGMTTDSDGNNDFSYDHDQINMCSIPIVSSRNSKHSVVACCLFLDESDRLAGITSVPDLQ